MVEMPSLRGMITKEGSHGSHLMWSMTTRLSMATWMLILWAASPSDNFLMVWATVLGPNQVPTGRFSDCSPVRAI